MNVPSKEDQTAAAISFLRIFAGIAMLPYGFGKIANYEALSQNFFGDPIGIGMLPSLWLTIFAQVLCAAFLIVGWQTRFSALMLFINMAVATKFHFFDPFVPTSSLPIIYMAVYAFLLVVGGGSLSLDAILYKKYKNDPICAAFKPNLSDNFRFIYMLMGFAAAVVAFAHILNIFLSVLLLLFAFGCFMSATYGYCTIGGYVSKKLAKK